LQRKTTKLLPFAAGHWQRDEAQGGDADGDHYQTFEVDEDRDTSLTPEKKHFKSNKVDFPDVIPLTQFNTNPAPPCTVDEQINKRVTKGFRLYSIAEEWECLRQLNRTLKNNDRLHSRLYCYCDL